MNHVTYAVYGFLVYMVSYCLHHITSDLGNVTAKYILQFGIMHEIC